MAFILHLFSFYSSHPLGFLEADTRRGLGKTGREVGKLDREDISKSKMYAVKQVDTESNWILMLWELW